MDARSPINRVSVILLTLAVASACVTAVDTTQSTNPSVNQSSQGGSSTTTNAKGISCTADTDTGTILCLGTTACPNVLVDTVKFPNCGFRTFSPGFDLECVCFGNYLCSVGTAASCQAVTTIFSTTTLSEVCNGVSLDYCKLGAASAAQGTGGATSNCDQTCYSTCVGAPACIVACGC